MLKTSLRLNFFHRFCHALLSVTNELRCDWRDLITWFFTAEKERSTGDWKWMQQVLPLLFGGIHIDTSLRSQLHLVTKCKAIEFFAQLSIPLSDFAAYIRPTTIPFTQRQYFYIKSEWGRPFVWRIVETSRLPCEILFCASLINSEIICCPFCLRSIIDIFTSLANLTILLTQHDWSFYITSHFETL